MGKYNPTLRIYERVLSHFNGLTRSNENRDAKRILIDIQ